MKKVQITVTDLDTGEERIVARFDCDDYYYQESRGTTREYEGNEVSSIGYNGQARIQLQAWHGCADFDSFESGRQND